MALCVGSCLTFILLMYLPPLLRCDNDQEFKSDGRFTRETGTAYFISLPDSDTEAALVDFPHSHQNRGKRSLQPSITDFSARSTVSSRFAETVFHCEMYNPFEENSDVVFKVQLPSSAFISNFTMVINGQLYVAQVKAKAVAREEYEEAVKRNLTAGLVSSGFEEPNRDFEWFVLSVNVGSKTPVIFELSYQELLMRSRGFFTHALSIQPSQVVENFVIYVEVNEPQGIASFEVEEPISPDHGSLVDTVITASDNGKVKAVTFKPKDQKVQALINDLSQGSQFKVKYDVIHEYDAGNVQIEDEYFVHFFSPAGTQLIPLGKNIVFVVDISGSMSGQKILQTREAMLTILDQLRAEDFFLILLFDSVTSTWPRIGDVVPATSRNIADAKDFVTANLVASGGTNIYDALVQAVNIIKTVGKVGSNMIIFLTDGEATSGETRSDVITQDVSHEANGKVSIFSLGFGFRLDYSLLQSLSYRTGGFPRRIYEDQDASEQLGNFFDEIATPLIYDVRIDYPDSVVDENSLTSLKFTQYFDGSEIVVAGKLIPDSSDQWRYQVSGRGADIILLTKSVDSSLIPPDLAAIVAPGTIERMYAYYKIKNLLLDRYIYDDADLIKESEQHALDLALHYKLVTRLTSLVITEINPQARMKSEIVKDENSVMSADVAMSSVHSSSISFQLSPVYYHIPIVCLILLFQED